MSQLFFKKKRPAVIVAAHYVTPSDSIRAIDPLFSNTAVRFLVVSGDLFEFSFVGHDWDFLKICKDYTPQEKNANDIVKELLFDSEAYVLATKNDSDGWQIIAPVLVQGFFGRFHFLKLAFDEKASDDLPEILRF